MSEPEDKEEEGAESDEKQDEAKKTVDTFSLTLIALGTSGTLFYAMNLAYGRWNFDPGHELLMVFCWIAINPLLCLLVIDRYPKSVFIERAFKASAYVCLATAVLGVVGLQVAHVTRHGLSHWYCLGASQAWQDKHPDIHGTVVAFRCGADDCTRDQAAIHSSPKMVVEFDQRAWYEVYPGPADAECRSITFSLKQGAWLPNFGSRVAAASDICSSIMPRTDSAWHPIH
ncbi:MAG: hypothetical protein WC551_05000 [Patescibacteria group bacterium]